MSAGNLARYSLLLAMGLQTIAVSPAASAAHTRDEQVDDLVLVPRPHGIGYREAQALGPGALSRLLEVLGEPAHRKYWVNAVVAIGFLEDPAAGADLVAFYRRTAHASDLESLRAHLAVPFALGAIAAREGQGKSLGFLLSELAGLDPASEERLAGIPVGRERLERLVLGLAISAQPEAVQHLRSFERSGKVASLAPRRRADIHSALQGGFRLLEQMEARGRASYFAAQPYVGAGTRGRGLPGKGLPLPGQVAARRHLLTTTYGDAELDLDLARATEVLFSVDDDCIADGQADVACPVSFTRSGAVSTFGTDSDGLEVVTTEGELSAVLGVGGARVKAVSSLDYCGGFNPSIIGCAPLGGETMVLEVGWEGTSLFVHEYGHNRGLNHRDGCAANLMSSSMSRFSPETVVDEAECAAFGGAGVTVPLTIEFGGDGSGQVTLQPGGQSCLSTCVIEIPYGTDVELLLTEDAGSVRGGCGGPCTVSMDAGRSIEARFIRRSTVAAVLQILAAPGAPTEPVFANGFEPDAKASTDAFGHQ